MFVLVGILADAYTVLGEHLLHLFHQFTLVIPEVLCHVSLMALRFEVLFQFLLRVQELFGAHLAVVFALEIVLAVALTDLRPVHIGLDLLRGGHIAVLVKFVNTFVAVLGKPLLDPFQHL